MTEGNSDRLVGKLDSASVEAERVVRSSSGFRSQAGGGRVELHGEVRAPGSRRTPQAGDLEVRRTARIQRRSLSLPRGVRNARGPPRSAIVVGQIVPLCTRAVVSGLARAQGADAPARVELITEQ